MKTRVEAKNEIYKTFFDQLTLEAPAVVGYVPDVRWKNIEGKGKPPNEQFYLRAMMDVVDSPQIGMTDCTIPNAQRLYGTEGFATFKIYAPRFEADSSAKSELLAQKLRTAFRKHRLGSDVWFRKARINEERPEDQFIVTVLTVQFYFTEVE